MKAIQSLFTLLCCFGVPSAGMAQTPTEADLRQGEFMMKSQIQSIMQDGMRSIAYGEGMLNASNSMLPFREFTDEAKALIEEFRATYKEKNKAKRETQQQAIIDRLDGVVVLKIARAVAITPEASNEPTTRKNHTAATASPSGEDLRLNDSDLFRDNLEKVTPRYSMPAELTSEQAVALINDVQHLEEFLKSFPKILHDYKARVASTVNLQVQDKLWQRLVSKQGFKDTAIGQDWYVIAVEHLSLIGAVEELLSTGAELAGLAIATNRLSGVRMRLIGSRVTLGDRAFVKSALAWLRTREEQVNENLARIIILEQRLKSEGVLPK
mgnify:CR=1 FL=1